MSHSREDGGKSGWCSERMVDYSSLYHLFAYPTVASALAEKPRNSRLLLRWPNAIVREGVRIWVVQDGTSHQFGVYAKLLDVWNVREIEPERHPAGQVIDSSQKQPRNANDIIGALERDVCTIEAIHTARHSVDDDDGRIICGIHRRVREYTHPAPTLTERSIQENVLLGKELIKSRVVGFPCIVMLASEPITDFSPRAFVIESEVHEEVPCFDGCPVQRFIRVERMQIENPRHAVHY